MSDMLDYQQLVDNAMRDVVRQSLKAIEKTGVLPGEHHFYVSFKTGYPGVSISEGLRSRFPEEITVVIQHQFWDMKVDDDRFQVTLSFSNVPEKLVIPFAALTAFADPSVKFGLQFHVLEAPAANDEILATPEEIGEVVSAQVLSLDAFRKK